MMKRPLLLQISGGLGDRALEAAIAGALGKGFDGVELCLHGQEPRSLCIPKQSHVGAVAISCLSCGVGQVSDEIMRWLECAASLGASCLNLTIPRVRPCDDGTALRTYQDTTNFTCELSRNVRYEAERTGIALALEAATDGHLLSPVELRDMIDDAHCWAVGACVDLDRIARLASFSFETGGTTSVGNECAGDASLSADTGREHVADDAAIVAEDGTISFDKGYPAPLSLPKRGSGEVDPRKNDSPVSPLGEGGAERSQSFIDNQQFIHSQQFIDSQSFINDVVTHAQLDWIRTLGRRMKSVRISAGTSIGDQREENLTTTLDTIRFEGPVISHAWNQQC